MSSGFVTEKELEEKRKVRQEEWDRVRKAEDPLEAPVPAEELKDRRSLYDRLQEQKMKKQEEFEEAHKLKNLVRGLDDDEAEFLDHVDNVRLEEERRKRMEEAKELSDFRSKVVELREKETEQMIKQEIGLVKTEKKPVFADESLPSIGVKKTSQSKLLAGLVKRKSDANHESSVTKKSKSDRVSSAEEQAALSNVSSSGVTKSTAEVSCRADSAYNSNNDGDDGSNCEIPSVPYRGNLVCIGVLPGLASYTHSSSEDESNDSTSDSERQSPVRDLCGRKIEQHKEDENENKERK